MAEFWSKAPLLRSGTKVRGFKSHSLHNICSSVVECFPSKEVARVRFPSDVKHLKVARHNS